ncbi:MAG: C40 family peptidase [Nitrospirae bacterium]|nr:C40 family peptidase [Nitrospirota bacterium]
MKKWLVLFAFFIVFISTHAWAQTTYVVKNGDNLYRISRKFKVGIESIKEANNLESNKMRRGIKLVIPVKSGDKKTIVEDVNIVKVQPAAAVAEEIKALSESPEIKTISMREKLSLFAQKMMGIPYKFGSSTFMGIDCSAYVQKVFSLAGVPLPRTAREQFALGQPVNKEDLTIGDLVFFQTYASFPSHVGIYMGNRLFIHASKLYKGVTIDSLDTPYYFNKYIGAKRLLAEDISL